jgi:hypothetical protein
MHANKIDGYCDRVVPRQRNTIAKETDELENCELYDCLLPLFKVMGIWGLYFKPNEKHNDCANGDVTKTVESSRTTVSRVTQKLRRCYAVIVLIILWINVLRFTTCFERSDRFGLPLIRKLTTMSLALLSTIVQTSYFVSSHTGHLDSVLRSIHVNPLLAKRLRRLSSSLTYISLTFCVGSSGYFAYLLFYRNDVFGFVLAPFVTHIEIDKGSSIVAKISFLLLDVVSKFAFIAPFLMNFVLACALIEKFRSFNDRFRQATRNHLRFDVDLAAFRRHHQTLCRDVCLIDQMMTVCNAAGLCCNLVSSALMFYGVLVLYYTDSTAGIANVWYTDGKPGGFDYACRKWKLRKPCGIPS